MDPNESFTIIYEIYEELDIFDKKEFVTLIRIPSLYEAYVEELQLLSLSNYKTFIEVLESEPDGNTRYLVRLMMTFGYRFDPSATAKNGETALMKMVEWYDDLACEFIMNYKDDCLPDKVNVNGETALYLACLYKRNKVALLMIDTFGFRCLPKQQCADGKTALSMASKYCSYQVIEKMLDAFGSSYDQKMLCVALYYIDNRTQDDDLVRYNTAQNFFKLGVPKVNFKSECLMFAYMDFLGDKFDPSVRIGDNQTYLISACWRDQDKFAIHLIRTYGSRCDPSATDDTGETALTEACRNKMSNVAGELLINFGKECNIGAINEDGETALDLATQNGMDDVVELINRLI